MCSRTSLVPVTAPRTLVIRFQRTKKALVTVHATSRSQLNYHLYTMFDTLCSGQWLHLQLYYRRGYLLPLQLPTYLPSCFSCMLWTFYGIFYCDILQLTNSKLHTCIDVYSKVMTFFCFICSTLYDQPIGEVAGEAVNGGRVRRRSPVQRRSPDHNAPIYGELLVLG